MGIALRKQGKLEEAITAYKKAIELDPNDAAAYGNLGIALRKQGKLEEAITAYKQAIELNPNDAAAYGNLGNALDDQEKIEEAIAAYKKAIAIDPNDATTYYNLGYVLRKQEKLEEAIVAYKKAIELDPDDPDAYRNLGVTLSKQGKLEEAITAYKKAIEFNPNDTDVYIHLALALFVQGEYQEAILMYQQAIQLNQNNSDAKNAGDYIGLGLMLSAQKQYQEALLAYQKALSLLDQEEEEIPANAYTIVYNGLGNIFQQQGKYQEAISEYEKAIKLDPSFVIAQNNLKEAQRLLAKASLSPLSTIDDRQHLPPEIEEPLVKKLRSTARIISTISEGSSIGTGWVIKRQGNNIWIVTNRHVISDSRSQSPSEVIEVEFFSELPDAKRPRYKAILEKITDNQDSLDLAVLKVEGIPNDIEPLEFSLGRIERNNNVTIIGHPYNVKTPWTSVIGQITNYSPNDSLIPLDALVAQGNSGGPVLNAEGQVIAMMVGIRAGGDIAVDPSVETPLLRDISPATGSVGLAYRIDIVIRKLQEWGYGL